MYTFFPCNPTEFQRCGFHRWYLTHPIFEPISDSKVMFFLLCGTINQKGQAEAQSQLQSHS